MNVMKMQCGCKIAYEDDNEHLEVWQSIIHIYCPMHKAAPLMYEALRALIVDGGPAGNPMVDASLDKLLAAQAALSAAGGSDGNQ